LLEELDELLSIDARKSGQKVVDRLPGFQVVEERLDRHPVLEKTGVPPMIFGLREMTDFFMSPDYYQVRARCNLISCVTSSAVAVMVTED